MIEHLVLFKALPGHDAELRAGFAAFVPAILQALPGISDFTWGENFNPRSKAEGYTHALHCRFADRDTLKAYATHPEHLKLLTILDVSTSSRVAIDYEPAA